MATTPHSQFPKRVAALAVLLACALAAVGVLSLRWSPEGEPAPPAPDTRSGSEGSQDALAPEPVTVRDLGDQEAPAEPETEAGSEPADDAEDDETRSETEALDGVAAPQRIAIPAIDVDSQIVPVGLKDDGAMEVPDFGLAGWYTEGPKPGATGPSTVVAHVDSRDGPDVFFRLRDLERGDEVHIHQADGSSVTFVVEERERAPKDELPDDRIWGWTDEPTLRLITCDGLFDRAVGHYEDNLILYLSLQSD